MKTSTLKMGRLEWLLLLLLALLWGSSFLFMKIAVQALPVFTVVLGRIGIAALLVSGFVYARRLRWPKTAKRWGQLILLGFLRAGLPISLFVWAGTQIDSNLSGILNSTTPLFTAIVAHALTQDEKLNGARITGILLGMAGVIMLIGISVLQGLGSNVLGQLAILGATCSYGFSNVYGRRFKDMPVAVSTAGLLFGATVIILPLALVFDQPWTLHFSLQPTLAVLVLAVVNTAIAFLVWLTLILRAGATHTAQVTFIIPFVSIVLGFLFLGEQIGWNALVGLGFILMGLAVSRRGGGD
jgi:drug/metabolite transporter (DMT)-like permease